MSTTSGYAGAVTTLGTLLNPTNAQGAANATVSSGNITTDTIEQVVTSQHGLSVPTGETPASLSVVLTGKAAQPLSLNLTIKAPSGDVDCGARALIPVNGSLQTTTVTIPLTTITRADANNAAFGVMLDIGNSNPSTPNNTVQIDAVQLSLVSAGALANKCPHTSLGLQGLKLGS